MAFTALERLFATERLRQRAAPQGGFAVPAMHERAATDSDGPFLATNMRAAFLPTRTSREGIVRYGFSLVPVGTDDRLLGELYRTLLSFPASDAPPRCTSVQQAIARLHSHGMTPRTLLIPSSALAEIVPGLSVEVAEESMRTKSEVAVVGDLTILLADLPDGAALVAAAPALVGVYTRVGDYLGVLVQQSTKTVVAVAA